jgi:hypothetical protein
MFGGDSHLEWVAAWLLLILVLHDCSVVFSFSTTITAVQKHQQNKGKEYYTIV